MPTMGTAYGGGLDVSLLSVPERRNAIHIECGLAAVGQNRLAVTYNGQAQFRYQRRRQDQITVEAGIDHGVDLPRLPRWAHQGKGHDGFEMGIHRPLDHSALRSELPPK